MAEIPESFRDLFEKRTLAHLATLLPGGNPHSVPVWIDYHAGANHLLVNTTWDSRKAKNVRENPHVAVSMTDPDDPYRLLSVRGEVVDLTEDGAVEHVNELASRYADVEEYPRLDEESNPRVLMKIRPKKVATQTPPDRTDD